MLGEAIHVVGVGVDGAKGHVAEQHIFSHSLGDGGKTLLKWSHD